MPPVPISGPSSTPRTHRVHALLRRWKNSAQVPPAPIPIRDAKGVEVGCLTPIDAAAADNPAIVAALTRWRQQFMDCFFSQFTATPGRTTKWLKAYADDDRRLLFLVVDAQQRPVGHVGLCNLHLRGAELDNVLRAEPSSTPGFGRLAVASLIDWLMAQLPIEEVTLRVFADNQRAISAYRSLGFEPTGTQPLVIEKSDDELRYRPADGAEVERATRHLLAMRLRRTVCSAAAERNIASDTVAAAH